MGTLAAIIGGVRSGKSRLAQERILNTKGLRLPAYLATVDSKKADEALREKILEHRLRRPTSWPTLDATAGPLKALDRAAAKGCDALLLDGLGMWVALQLKRGPQDIQDEMEQFCRRARERFKLSVMVLDEVGLGGVAAHKTARRFADLNGLANQRICSVADEVWLAVAGVGVKLKPAGKGKA